MAYDEGNYSEEGYDEGQESSIPVTCDLTPVIDVLNTLVIKVDTLQASVNSLGNDVAENNTILLAVNQIAMEIKADALTVDDLNTIIPFVDDSGLRSYPINTVVDVIGVDNPCVVKSSFFFPNGDWEYIIGYTVELVENGEIRRSSFPAHVVTRHVEV